MKQKILPMMVITLLIAISFSNSLAQESTAKPQREQNSKAATQGNPEVAAIRERLETEYGIDAYDADVIVNQGRALVDYFEVLDGLVPGEQVITSGYEPFADTERLVLRGKPRSS